MAVEQMKLLSITGKDSNLENFLAKSLLSCNIQIEDAKKIYNKGWKLDYYEYDYRVKEALKKCLNLLEKFEIDYSKIDNDYKKFSGTDIEDIDNKLEEINSQYETCLQKIDECKNRNLEILNFIDPLRKLENLDVEAQKLYDCKYLKFRCGNIPNDNIDDVKREIENMDVVLFELEKDDDVTWIIYFTTEEFAPDIDGYFNIQKFERIRIPEEVREKPIDYVKKCEEEIQANVKNVENEDKNIEKIKQYSEEVLLKFYNELQIYERINNLKKYILKDQNNTFYIVVWVPMSSMNYIVNMLNGTPDIDFVIKDAKKDMLPPTKLKNLLLFKPFEMIVKMYGVPNISELDPTAFIAIVTCLLFGFMFGDVGHGAIILLVGLIMLIKKNKAGAILFDGGLFSCIFGFLYGSVFGKEDIIKPILISPMENITTMLISGIAVGSILIILAMILNMINGIKTKDYKKVFLEGNGLPGFILYILVIGIAAYYFIKGKMIISISVIAGIVGILLLIILLNDKLSNLICRKKEKTEVRNYRESI